MGQVISFSVISVVWLVHVTSVPCDMPQPPFMPAKVQ